MKTTLKNERSHPARRIPQRTCVGCRSVKDKRKLVRLVRTPEGSIELDITGRKNGRGAYICPELACLEKALKDKKGLERALRTSLTEQDRARLAGEGRRLIEGLYGARNG